MLKADVIKLGISHGWAVIDEQDNISMVSFRRDNVRMNVYYTKMTVGTAMAHPTKGKTQLFRRNVSSALLSKLMERPRLHTRKGYYTK